MSKSMALASLTATYTDSEGEEEIEENDENQGTVTIHTPDDSPENKSTSTPSSRPASPVQVKVTTKVAKLVSYHDDTVVSDDDGDITEKHQIVIVSENESLEIVTDKVEDESVQLPPEPLGHCSMDLQEKILRLHERMQNNALDMNAVIQQRKDFRNPSIYEKLIQFCR